MPAEAMGQARATVIHLLRCALLSSVTRVTIAIIISSTRASRFVARWYRS
jgi:hypothetical protein